MAERAGRVAATPALSIDDEWHRAFYARFGHGAVSWRGIQLVKNPLDLVVFAEIIHEVRPAVIVETGTRTGGSALYFADCMTACGIPNPKVITVDVLPGKHLPQDPRITYIVGDSVAAADEVHVWAWGAEPRMVILDSDHQERHVFAELEELAYLVTPGSYLIVEDTNIAGNPVFSDTAGLPEGDGGPAAALHRWLPEHPEFSADREREKFGVTYNPGGWLRRR